MRLKILRAAARRPTLRSAGCTCEHRSRRYAPTMSLIVAELQPLECKTTRRVSIVLPLLRIDDAPAPACRLRERPFLYCTVRSVTAVETRNAAQSQGRRGSIARCDCEHGPPVSVAESLLCFFCVFSAIVRAVS